MWLIFILVGIALFFAKYIRDLHKFNLNASVRQLQDLNKVVVKQHLSDREPLVIHNVPPVEATIESIVSENPGYILKDADKVLLLSSFSDASVPQMTTYKNSELCKHIHLSESLLGLGTHFEGSLACNRKTYVSLMKGANITERSVNTHDILLIHQIQGHASLYIVNPKHKDDIKEKPSSQIKKWSHKINLEPNLLVSIPPNWHYFTESSEDIVQGVYESDTYPTWLYNSLR